jgi:hypothetical protein
MSANLLHFDIKFSVLRHTSAAYIIVIGPFKDRLQNVDAHHLT